jgi:hypothetical protein
MQNEEPSIYFTQPESISEGDIVWIYEGIPELVGPLFVDHYGLIGYGSNKRLIYKLVDTSTGSWHSSEKKWLRVPKEAKCN